MRRSRNLASPRRVARWAPLLLSLGALCLGACGDDNEGGAPTPAASRTATGTPASSPTGVVLTPTFQAARTATFGPIATASGGPEVTRTPPPTEVFTPSRTPGLLPQGGDGGAIEIEPTNGFPGDVVTIEVSLATFDAVAGTQNDLVLDARAPIRARQDGEPDCAGNPAIEKDAFSSFLPPGCTPGVDCSAVRVLVISLTNVDPIPSGSVLYTCNVAIAPEARLGDAVPLACENPGLSNPQGEELPAYCGDGLVVIGELPPTPTPQPTRTPAPPTPTRQPTRTVAPHAELALGTAAGAPGEEILVDVTLADVEQGYEVSATQNDILFPPGAHVVIKEDGKPDCSVNPAIDKGATAFAFLPSACAFPGCTSMRALVLAIDNVDPIPPGSVLYTCRWMLSDEAAAGDALPLPCEEALASDPGGVALGLRCASGEISVAAPPP